MKTKMKFGAVFMALGALFVVSVSSAEEQATGTTTQATQNVAATAGVAYERLILNGKINTFDIKDSTIRGRDIKRGTVKTGDIKDRTIRGRDIKSDAIGESKLKEDSVTSEKIDNGTIKTEDLANNSVTSAKISDGTVATADLADNAVNSAKISDGTVATADLADNAVNSAKISDGTVATADLADNAVNSAKILDGTIVGGDLASDISIDTTGDITVGGELAANGGITTDGGDDIGTLSSRWSTIYTDTLNFSTAITDSNEAGNDSAVNLGDDSTNDTVNITANTSVNDDEWVVTSAGAANFASIDSTPIGGTTAAAGTFTTLIGDTVQTDDTLSFLTNGESISNAIDAAFTFTRNDSGTVTISATDDDSDADLLVTGGGTGNLTLGDSDSLIGFDGDTIVYEGKNFSAYGDMVFGNGNDTVIIDSGDWDITSNGDVTGIGNITADGTVDLSGANTVIDSGTSTPGTCTTGQLFVDTDTAPYLFVCKSTNTWDDVAP